MCGLDAIVVAMDGTRDGDDESMVSRLVAGRANRVAHSTISGIRGRSSLAWPTVCGRQLDDNGNPAMSGRRLLSAGADFVR